MSNQRFIDGFPRKSPEGMAIILATMLDGILGGCEPRRAGCFYQLLVSLNYPHSKMSGGVGG
jgi:hypothetical protein